MKCVLEVNMRHAWKSTLICIAMLHGISYATRAHAADLPGNRAYSAPILASNWAGFYAGLHLGYGFGRARSADIDGFVGGVHGGFNLQSNQVVFGGEVDLNYTGVDSRAFTETFRQKWNASARARLGYAFDRFMPFITGGIAGTSATMKSGGTKESNTHIGYVLGIGGEMMITNNVSANLQLLHYRFGAETYNVRPASRNANIVTNEIRLGMSYKF
jgi:outer membrane immunogenic protein